MRLELPNGTFAGCDDEQIATALGVIIFGGLYLSQTVISGSQPGTVSLRPASLLYLGYVAHFVLMISKYQKVPLRYAIQPLASRSTITDDISDLPPSKAGRR